MVTNAELGRREAIKDGRLTVKQKGQEAIDPDRDYLENEFGKISLDRAKDLTGKIQVATKQRCDRDGVRTSSVTQPMKDFGIAGRESAIQSNVSMGFTRISPERLGYPPEVAEVPESSELPTRVRLPSEPKESVGSAMISKLDRILKAMFS